MTEFEERKVEPVKIIVDPIPSLPNHAEFTLTRPRDTRQVKIRNSVDQVLPSLRPKTEMNTARYVKSRETTLESSVSSGGRDDFVYMNPRLNTKYERENHL